MQRAALRGAETIAVVLDYQPQDRDGAKLGLVITQCYTWHAALVGVTGPGFGMQPGEPANGHRDIRPTALELLRV
jgi:hypothetical protein